MAKKNKALRRKGQKYTAQHHHQSTTQDPTRFQNAKGVKRSPDVPPKGNK